MGAAAQGGILRGDVKDVLLLDVTPLSLGLETLGGVSTKIIEKNTTIPVSKSQVFSTAADNQTSVEIHILQGEREMAGDNKTLGRFMLDGIPPAPRGLPQIEVVFDIDANGILNVSAVDKAAGKKQSVRIEASSGLSKEDIEKMKKEAELNAAEDKKKLAEFRNVADTLIYTAEKSLRDAGDKVPADTKKTIEEKIETLKKSKEGSDSGVIKKDTEELSRALQSVGEILYKAAQEAEQKSKKEAESGTVKEAEYEEVKEEKKNEDENK